MSNFNWESEEAWDEEIRIEAPDSPQRPWRRNALIIVLIGILIGGFALFGYQRVNAVNDEISREVISSHSLIQEAVRLQDRELFLSVLSGRSDEWVLTQSELFKQFNLDIRTAVGFVADDTVSNDVTLSVELDPGLNSAAVYRVQAYRDRFGESVKLELTDVYRLGQTRWLLAPPEAEFWGEWVEFEELSTIVETKFPERDAPYVWVIQQYLENKVAELCRDPAYQCPDDYKVRIVFHHDPYTLLQTTEPDFIYQQADQIVVPTPTLIGLPVNEAGQDVLARTYAAFILPKIIVDLIEYECCLHQFPLLQAFINRQLIDLEILPRLDQTAQAEMFFANPFFPSPIGFESGVDVYDELLFERAKLLAGYYLARTDLSTGNYIVLSAETGRRWMISANQTIVSGENRLQNLYRDFVHYAASLDPWDRSQVPADHLGVVCESEVERWVAGSYDLRTGRWQVEPIAYEGPIQSLRQLGDAGWVWIDGEGQEIWRFKFKEKSTDMIYRDTPRIMSLSFGESRALLSYSQMNLENGTLTPLFAPMEECLSGECTFLRSADNSFLFWNPVGDVALVYSGITAGDQPSYSLIGVDGNLLIEMEDLMAGRVYWEDNDSLLITRQEDDPNDMGIFRFEISDRTEEKLFDWSDVVNALPDNFASPPILFPFTIAGIPTHDDHFFMVVGRSDQGSDTARIIIYDAAKQAVPYSEPIMPGSGFELLVVENQARYGMVMSSDTVGPYFVPTLIDFEKLTAVPQASNIFSFVVGNEPQMDMRSRSDWTADGRWLAQFNDGFATVVDLEQGEKRVIPYPRGVGSCIGGGWINF